MAIYKRVWCWGMVLAFIGCSAETQQDPEPNQVAGPTASMTAPTAPASSDAPIKGASPAMSAGSSSMSGPSDQVAVVPNDTGTDPTATMPIPSIPQPDDPLLVRIDDGLVRGHEHAGPEPTLEFLGIPYAATTGGENRFRPPQRREPWGDEELVADRTGPDCLAIMIGDGIFGGLISDPPREPFIEPGHKSEDCLYLNIWTPAKEGKHPVMMWIHGGGLRIDSANRPPYVGNHLATRGDVVVVTLNYRLHTAGQLAHPVFTDPDTGLYGNWNVQDWLFAAEWVQRNISYFGGDPGNVTYFGESGGSAGANTLALVDKSKRQGLYHRIIAQSGDPRFTPLGVHETEAEEFFAALGCTVENAKECVRAASITDFRDAMEVHSASAAPDNILLKFATPIEAAMAGASAGLDIIGGENGPGDGSTTVHWTILATHNAVESGRAYRYNLPASPGVQEAHGSDISLVFGTYEDDLGNLNQLAQRSNPNVPRLSERMIKSWTNFAWTGDPSFDDAELGKVEWPTYDADTGYQTMSWDESPNVVSMDP
jgi:carboxylesterase type B